jgi:hypothetical protein
MPALFVNVLGPFCRTTGGKIGALDFVETRLEIGGRAVDHHSASPDHVSAVGESEGLPRVLFHEQNPKPGIGRLAHRPQQAIYGTGAVSARSASAFQTLLSKICGSTGGNSSAGSPSGVG